MLTYDMNLRGDEPLYEFLYESIAADIRAGNLPALKKLPSKRALAKHLGVSLITVESAFSQLIAEGYIRSVERKGYYVCDLPQIDGGVHAGARMHAGQSMRSDANAGMGAFLVDAARTGAGAGAGQSAFPAADIGARAFSVADAGTVVGSGSFPIARVDMMSPAFAGASEAAVVSASDTLGTSGVVRAFGALGALNDAVRAFGAATRKSMQEASSGVASQNIEFDLHGGSLSSAFPFDAWARCMREALSRESESDLSDTKSPLGTLRLRQVLADYLREYRGMDVLPQQIVVGAGAQYLYGMIIQLLNEVRGSCHVAIENPGYPRLEKIYRVNRVPVSYIPMDDQGIRMDLLAASGANVVHITPSHQFPTGLVTSVPRRYEILSWAAQDPNRFIVEDDYDCEFRLAGKPISPLQRLDAQGQVIYTNTFTKSLGGAFRIGSMVLPLRLAQRFERDLGFYSCSVSAVDQLALARFIESGAYERHVNRLRTQYRALRDALVGELNASALASRISIASQDSGIHFLLGVASDCSGEELAARAAREGVAIQALQSFYQGNAPEEQGVRWLVAGYSSLDTSQVAPCVRALERAWA